MKALRLRLLECCFNRTAGLKIHEWFTFKCSSFIVNICSFFWTWNMRILIFWRANIKSFSMCSCPEWMKSNAQIPSYKKLGFSLWKECITQFIGLTKVSTVQYVILQEQSVCSTFHPKKIVMEIPLAHQSLYSHAASCWSCRPKYNYLSLYVDRENIIFRDDQIRTCMSLMRCTAPLSFDSDVLHYLRSMHFTVLSSPGRGLRIITTSLHRSFPFSAPHI